MLKLVRGYGEWRKMLQRHLVSVLEWILSLAMIIKHWREVAEKWRLKIELSHVAQMVITWWKVRADLQADPRWTKLVALEKQLDKLSISYNGMTFAGAMRQKISAQQAGDNRCNVKQTTHWTSWERRDARHTGDMLNCLKNSRMTLMSKLKEVFCYDTSPIGLSYQNG